MGLNRQKGNMYPWVTHTLNFIKGKCLHNCVYCYMKRWGKQSPLHFDESEFNTDIGEDKVVFVGSSCDMFADDVPDEWIDKVLHFCKKQHHSNTFLFQTKNPQRLFHYAAFPSNFIVGTTIESNRNYGLSDASVPYDRYVYLKDLPVPRMVSIEPIVDFDLSQLVEWMKNINPNFVSIGADSQGHNLPEPSRGKTLRLIESLKSFTDVKVKKNLNRIIK